jgi:Protein of unknown function (DUF3618)
MRDESLDLEHIMTADPDQIRRQIERTQQVLSADVNALAEKVSPRRAVARRTDRARRTLTNVKDMIMGTARDAVSAVGDAATGAASTASDTARNAASTATDTASSVALATADRVSSIASSAADAVGSAPQAVRRRVQGKQLAAGLITFGAGWLAASVMKVSRQERKLLAEATDRRGECLEPMAQQAEQVAADVAGNVREPAQLAIDSVASTASDAATTVGDQAPAAANQVRDRTGDATRDLAARTH